MSNFRLGQPPSTMRDRTPAISVIAAAPLPKPVDRRYAPGHLEVLKVRKLRYVDGVFHLDGVPASKDSHVRNARITFVPSGQPVPNPSCDPAHGSMDLFYPETERKEVEGVLNKGRERLCYFWEDGHHTRMRAWLMATN